MDHFREIGFVFAKGKSSRRLPSLRRLLPSAHSAAAVKSPLKAVQVS